MHLVVIGAGPGGYVAAIRAAQYGARVTVIENQALGGVCLNWGCIPSKALLSVVELGQRLQHVGESGLRVQGAVHYDLPAMVARKNRVVTQLVQGIATLFQAWGITYLYGTGTLLTERVVQVTAPDGTTIKVDADAIVIATGSSWPTLPLFPIDGKQILTSKEALDLTEVPSSLLIVGGGVEGCEFASLFAALGSRVTMVEMLSRVLPTEDEEVSRLIERELKKQQVQIYTGTTVERLERGGDLLRVTLHSGVQFDVSTVLVSVGRRYQTQGLGLEQVGVQLGERGEIVVNDHLETTVPGIYAIGDVVGKAMLAHVASAQGKVAVANAMGRRMSFDDRVIPAGIFTLPEIGRVGLTEQEAQAQGIPVKIGRFRYMGLGKAHATGETIGLFKVVADASTGIIRGVHIIGAHATDLIHEAALAIKTRTTLAQIGDMMHAHPTFAEGLLEACEDGEGLAIHQVRRRG
ncbi:MAG: dihydrolipoyl dehydrogenase [Nitrospirae bacterium]|nr:MAG: dihydrolipoyl dehydrogenase [Nitrospirota bacterium]